MARETGTASSLEDLVEKLKIFAAGLATTPWTVDDWDPTNNRLTIHRGSCYVSFRWANSGYQLGIYQSLGWTTSQDAHLHPDDSGNGQTSTPITTGRRVNLTTGAGGTDAGSANAGPYTSYDFFASEGATPTIYVKVETVNNLFRHFGFGHLVKYNDFTGGEFAFGHYHNPAGGSGVADPKSIYHNFLLDGFGNNVADQATMHLEGFPGQAVGGKWGVFYNTHTSIGNDRAGVARLQLFGGARSGLYGYALGWIRASQSNAHKLLIPIGVLLRSTAAAPHTWRWLGEMPDIALINMHFYAPGDEIVVGGTDTYVVYPWVRKQKIVASSAEESWNAGVAYRVT